MTLEEFFKRLEEENRLNPGTHGVESGLSNRELLLWEKDRPGMTVPEDLVALLRSSNGLRIRLNKDSPCGAALRFLPLREIRNPGSLMYGDDSGDEEIPRAWVCVAHDADNTSFLVLDVATGDYREVDPIDLDGAKRVASNVEGALDWVAGYFSDSAQEDLT